MQAAEEFDPKCGGNNYCLKKYLVGGSRFTFFAVPVACGDVQQEKISARFHHVRTSKYLVAIGQSKEGWAAARRKNTSGRPAPRRCDIWTSSRRRSARAPAAVTAKAAPAGLSVFLRPVVEPRN